MDKRAALETARTEYERWEALLADLSEGQITAGVLEGGWSIKDVVAHLKGWQELTQRRLEAGQYGHEPVRPNWPAELDLETESNVDEINGWIYAMHRAWSWSSVYRVWRFGYLRLLALAEAIPDTTLLEKKSHADGEDYSLAETLVFSAEHHAEHRESLREHLPARGEDEGVSQRNAPQ